MAQLNGVLSVVRSVAINMLIKFLLFSYIFIPSQYRRSVIVDDVFANIGPRSSYHAKPVRNDTTLIVTTSCSGCERLSKDISRGRRANLCPASSLPPSSSAQSFVRFRYHESRGDGLFLSILISRSNFTLTFDND